MLIISKKQILELNNLLFIDFKKIIIAKILSDDYSSHRDKMWQEGYKLEHIIKFVEEQILEAQNLGFKTPNEISPFIAFNFVFNDSFTNSGLYQLILQILNAVKFDPIERMDSVYEILSERERLIYFNF